MTKIRFPSPALVVAVVALFVALGGTAVAASPVVKRALFADNAGKLQKKTPAQIAAIPGPATTLEGKTAAQIAETPGPASTAAGLLTVKSVGDSIGADAEREYTISCDSGRKVAGGGFSSNGAVMAFDSRPVNETTWGIYLVNLSRSQGFSVSLYATCLA